MKGSVDAYIGVGSNFRPEENILNALNEIRKHVMIEEVSTFYRTPPLGGRKQPDYLNGVWHIATPLAARTLKHDVLVPIESVLRRVRTDDDYASRTIDLDLILYGDGTVDGSGLGIPDPDIYTRHFVAVPLFELNPGLVLPDTGRALSDVVAGMTTEGLVPEEAFTELLRRRIKE